MVEFWDLVNVFCMFPLTGVWTGFISEGCPFLAGVLRRVRHRASGVTYMPKAGSREHLGTGCVMLTLWAPREVGLLEIPEGRVWCWEHCGSTVQPPALAQEEQPHCQESGLAPCRRREVGALG